MTKLEQVQRLAEKTKERAKKLMAEHDDEEHTKLFLDANAVLLQLRDFANNYHGKIWYMEEDVQFLQELGVEFRGKPEEPVGGGIWQECTISRENFDKLEEHWGRFIWALE